MSMMMMLLSLTVISRLSVLKIRSGFLDVLDNYLVWTNPLLPLFYLYANEDVYNYIGLVGMW